MSGASQLKKAQKNKNDEWYTQLEDIENELLYYKEHFRDKVVFCNCDDPYESNFFKYFAMNFNFLGLKKLIATCYASSPIMNTQLTVFDDNSSKTANNNQKKPYKIEISEVNDYNGDGAVDLSDVEFLLKSNKNVLSELNGDGDFRSEECVELLKQADIVVTNPPFSLFREYVGQLMQYDKKFLIIGRTTALHAKEIFPLIKDTKIWCGYGFNKTIEFIMSDAYKLKGKAFMDSEGRKHGFVPGICWFTNLDIQKRHEKFIFYKKYTPKTYPKYDNFDAIEVGTVKEIPDNYYEPMGVPDTFLNQYNPEEFEILGRSGDTDWVVNHCDFYIQPSPEKSNRYKKYNINWRKQNAYLVDENGNPYKIPYSRIFIKRRKNI